MGDRRMAEVKTSNGSLYFYTHSHGFTLPDISREAMRTVTVMKRQDDEEYAVRIILDYLIENTGSHNSPTGSGISLAPNMEDQYSRGFEPTVIIDLVDWSLQY